jgi:hypothetical protein
VLHIASSSIRPSQHCHLCKNVWTKPVNIRVFFRLRPSTFHAQLPFRKEAKKFGQLLKSKRWKPNLCLGKTLSLMLKAPLL